MGDVHIPQPEPNAIGAKVQELIDSGHELYATTVTGSSSGRVRRPTLFAVSMVGVGLAIIGFVPGGVVALIAMSLLATSDSVVEL